MSQFPDESPAGGASGSAERRPPCHPPHARPPRPGGRVQRRATRHGKAAALSRRQEAEPYLGLPVHAYKLAAWLVKQTQPQDWEEGSRPIAWPSARHEAEFLGLSPARVKQLNRALIRPKSWSATIREQRRQIEMLLRESPSLGPFVATALTESCSDARDDAVEETGLAETELLAECPFTLEEVLSRSFFPEP